MKVKATQKRFTDEFKEQAVKQVTERGHKVSEVASRLGISANSLYAWLKRYAVSPEQPVQQPRLARFFGRPSPASQHEPTRQLP